MKNKQANWWLDTVNIVEIIKVELELEPQRKSTNESLLFDMCSISFHGYKISTATNPQQLYYIKLLLIYI